MKPRPKLCTLSKAYRTRRPRNSRAFGFKSYIGHNVLSRSNIIWPVSLTTLAGGVSCFYLLSEQPRFKSTLAHKNDTKPGYFDQSSNSKDSEHGEKSKPVTEKLTTDWNIFGWKLPEWAHAVPGFIDKLQNELVANPGTLADEIWKEAQDPQINPEIARQAKVRVSSELCEEEKQYLVKRKASVRKALAKYLNLSEDEIHPDDVPTIGMCGSGGGLRALVAGASSYYSAQEEGLYDCVTYTAGVSGSCWLQTLYYSTIAGQSYTRLLEHLKNRIGTHIAFPPSILKLLTTSPTHKFLLSGGYEKYRAFEGADFGLVDLYGVLLGGRLLVPKGDLAVDYRDLKLSNQARYVNDGKYPLPIYTAVRHEIPAEEEDSDAKAQMEEQAEKEAYFQWFEFTPYELWCEEFAAGIPAWSVGREFDKGRSVAHDNGLALPEIRVPLLMGIFGSAFCATLSHYYHEIRPLLKGIIGLGGLDEMLQEREDDLSKLHPVQPAAIPNYLRGIGKENLPKSCPESIHHAKVMELMDAGMSNNLPIYPLLRPGRDVDIVITFDASADIQDDNWLRVADGYARQRGIKGWPVGIGWPEKGKGSEDQDISHNLDEADKASNQQANNNVKEAEANAADHQHQNEKTASDTAGQEAQGGTNPESAAGKVSRHQPTELGYCNVWVGTTEERVSADEPPESKLVEKDWEIMTPDAGIVVIYFPFMANPKVEGVDPNTSDYLSTWNFIYTPEQVDKVVSLARENFSEGREQVKMAVRAVYERKKKLRLEREKEQKRRPWTIAKWTSNS